MDEINPDAEHLEDKQDRPGAVLRRAREERGLSLGDVAGLTRIAQRQLEAIERSDFASLPGTPYAVGFARAYARAVGADEVAVAQGVREELGTMEAAGRHEIFEPVDPARIPPRSLAWTAALIALLLAVGYAVWRTQFFASSTDQEISDISNRASEQPVPSAERKAPEQAATTGPVVLTALDDVWLRIYDQAGERLLEKQMTRGETYTVPPQANNPMILTGRPDAFAVTVGGRQVAPLGPPDRTITDVPISAAALLARAPVPEAPSKSNAEGAGGATAANPSEAMTSQPLVRRPADMASVQGPEGLSPAASQVLEEAQSAVAGLAPLEADADRAGVTR